MNARYYLPGIGRFLSADTLIPDPSNPQSWNRYAYVLSNPLRFTDPSGHWYYDPACDCLIDTNEYPDNLYVPTAENTTNDACSIDCWLAKRNSAWPDYVTVQISFAVFTGAFIMDTYSNTYVTVGLTAGVETPTLLGASITN